MFRFVMCAGLVSWTLVAKTVVRGAFDVGSGSTKLKVCSVDTDLQKIVTCHYPTADRKGSVKVAYQADLATSADKKFSEGIVKKGLEAIQQLKQEALQVVPKDAEVTWAGVATGAFRAAENAKEVVQHLSKEAQISFRIISQQEEAELGFIGASSRSKVAAEDLVVWDIGGATQQISYLQGKEVILAGSKLASETFKQDLIKAFNKDNTKTPNPLSKDEAAKALVFIRAVDAFPEALRTKLKDKKTQVVGIGGVLAISVAKKATQEGVVKLEVLKEILPKYLDKTDKEIGGDYADTEVSNLILVAGLMENLNLSQFIPADVNNADGALVSPKIWR